MSGKYLTRSIKTALVAVFTFQLLSTVERQVFDFLGYMWAPIIGNFFQIIAVILGLFGACQHYRSFVVVYAIWSLLWLGWNIFVICLYLEVGILNRNRNRYILTIGTESKSWWLEHGIGCNITNTSWLSSSSSSSSSSSTPPDAGRPIPPEEYVEGCILQYYYVEVIHAAVQVLLALVGLGVAVSVIQASLEEEDATIPANDELEFVMIRSRSPSSTTTTAAATATATITTALNHKNSFHNLAFDSDDNNNNDDDPHHHYYHRDEGSTLYGASFPSPPPPCPFEQLPSYETSVRNAEMDKETRAADQYYYASHRLSARSKRSAMARERGGNQASGSGRRSNRQPERRVDRDYLPSWMQEAPPSSSSTTMMMFGDVV